MRGSFGVTLPKIISGPVINYDPNLGQVVATGSLINLPALVVVTLCTIILVVGIRESASFNATMVFVKVTAVIFVIAVGAFFVNPDKLTGLFVGAMAAFLPINILLNLVNMGTLLAFAIVCAAVLIMRRTNPEAERPFRAPWVPFVPIAGILSCLLLMFSLPLENWLRLIVWLAIGLVIYFLYSRKHSVMAQQRAK